MSKSSAETYGGTNVGDRPLSSGNDGKSSPEPPPQAIVPSVSTTIKRGSNSNSYPHRDDYASANINNGTIFFQTILLSFIW